MRSSCLITAIPHNIMPTHTYVHTRVFHLTKVPPSSDLTYNFQLNMCILYYYYFLGSPSSRSRHRRRADINATFRFNAFPRAPPVNPSNILKIYPLLFVRTLHTNNSSKTFSFSERSAAYVWPVPPIHITHTYTYTYIYIHTYLNYTWACAVFITCTYIP